jgi:ribose transport system permease protein
MTATRTRYADYAGMLLTLTILVAVFSLQNHRFFSVNTLIAIANQVPVQAVIVVGMTFVLVIGGIDLSVGSVMALCATVLGTALADWRWSLPPALALTLLTGLAMGALNGALTVFARVPSFIVTLGTMEIARGLAYLVTDSRTKYIGSAIEVLGPPLSMGLSLGGVSVILVVVLGQLLLSRTVFGRYAVGIGTSEETMRLSGIDTDATKLSVFALSGLLTALGAIIFCIRLEAADPNAGSGLELQVIAAAVIGGASPLGGQGSVVKSFFGVLIIAVLNYGLAQIGASDPTKRIIIGSAIIAAVAVDLYRRPPAGKSAAGRGDLKI